MSTNTTNLARKGQQLFKQIKSLNQDLENIKKQLRDIASLALSERESQNAVFDIEDDNGTIISQVRFPPSSISLSPNHIERVIQLIGKTEFDRLFTIRQQVITNTDQLDDLDPNTAEILGDYITLKENTPRVSFK
tara:strand:- start:806 stop:1210 length:405 start_codon:yes stop_codon:yes gene_type:complete